jgi:hypothetical protein
MDGVEVLSTLGAGHGKKRVATLLGLDLKTVRRYLGSPTSADWRREGGAAQSGEGLVSTVVGKLQAAPGRSHGDRWARCQEHRTVVEQYLKQGLRLTKIRKLLQRQGILISEPGQECQADTGWIRASRRSSGSTGTGLQPRRSPGPRDLAYEGEAL